MEEVSQEQREHRYANVLLVGRPKQGKTTGALSAPGQVGFLNFGEPNAAELGHEMYGDRIHEMKVRGVSVKGLISEVMQSCYSEDAKIDTWVCDPLGDMHRRLFREMKPPTNVGNAMRDAYGQVAMLVEEFCRFMCEAPCNFVMVAHDNTVDKEEPAHPWTGTNNPANGHKVMQMVDVIAYVGLLKGEDNKMAPMAQIVPTENRPTGVRGRFNRLLTPEVRESGFVPLDLTDWFTTADKWLGEPDTNAAKSGKKGATT